MKKMKNKYQILMERKDRAEEVGRTFTDEKLRTFYSNVAKGFELKANKLRLSEVE